MHAVLPDPSLRKSSLAQELCKLLRLLLRSGSMCVIAICLHGTVANAQTWDTANPANPVNASEQEYWWLANQQQFTTQSQQRLANESFAPSYVPTEITTPQNTMVQWQTPSTANNSNLYKPSVNPVQPQGQVQNVIQSPQEIISEQNTSAQLPTENEMSAFFGTNPNGACSTTCINPDYNCGETWTHQFLPDGLIYSSYLAAPRESRMRSYFFYKDGYGSLWDITLGGRVGLWRYGTTNNYFPEGWQIDLEGAATPRLDFEHDMNVVSADFRAGLPITYGVGPWRTKFGYYHLSSHLGDEQLIMFPNTPRYNYTRDALIIGQSYYILPTTRVYAETSWAFNCDVAEPWEFQFGVEYAPALPTGLRGAPYAAANALLREEVNYSGCLTVQAGWSWREGPSAHLLRIGVEYFNGLSDQGQFWNQFEQKIGAGIWFDY